MCGKWLFHISEIRITDPKMAACATVYHWHSGEVDIIMNIFYYYLIYLVVWVHKIKDREISDYITDLIQETHS